MGKLPFALKVAWFNFFLNVAWFIAASLNGHFTPKFAFPIALSILLLLFADWATSKGSAR